MRDDIVDVSVLMNCLSERKIHESARGLKARGLSRG